MNYSRSGYALQYSDGRLAGIDKGGAYSAPGYPFVADDISSVEVFPTLEAAEKATFSFLKIVHITEIEAESPCLSGVAAGRG